MAKSDPRNLQTTIHSNVNSTWNFLPGSYIKKHGPNPQPDKRKYRDKGEEEGRRENFRTEKMEKRLSEAAMKGSVESLLRLLQEDPLILHKSLASCVDQSPLHLSSLVGHIDFVKELLIRNPDFAAELDSDGCSPLHLAAAKGHLEIVKQLLVSDPEMGKVRNSGGRTPLHVAAVKGRVEVLCELVRFVPDSTRVVTHRGETGLHLCVRHSRLAALKFLFEAMRKDGEELVNWRDSDGYTILHIAVAKKQISIIEFLLTTGALEVNALNKNGSTSLDILKQSPRDLADLEIEDLLRHAGGISAKDLHLITSKWVPTKVPEAAKRLSSHKKSLKKPIPKHKHTDWLGRKRSALMVVASLIATVAFQAGLTPPGGVWQDDSTVDSNGNPVDEPHTVGTAVMAYKEPLQYSQFMIFNTIAFLASLSIILLLVSGLPLKRRRWMWIQMVIMWISITAQVLTYFIALRNMSPKSVNTQSMLRKVTEISVLTWLCLMGVVFIGNVIRMNLWILRKYGYIKEKERDHEEINDEEEEEEEG